MNNFDILLLGETWLHERSNINGSINEFECEHLFARKSLGAKRGRYSGGISIYYKTYLKDHVKIVEKSPYGFVWTKIDSKILNQDSDVYLCYCYMRDKNSRVLRHEDVDLFEILENAIADYKTKGVVFVTGDLNCRTGDSETDIIEYDRYIQDGIEEYYCLTAFLNE